MKSIKFTVKVKAQSGMSMVTLPAIIRHSNNIKVGDEITIQIYSIRRKSLNQ